MAVMKWIGNNETTPANAAFIVKACNEHALLCRMAEAAQRVADNPVNKYLVQLDDAPSALQSFREGGK